MSSPVYAVVLAGGSGTRFWPASRRLVPKQLLPIGPVADRSLLRGTVERLRGLIPAANLLVATGRHLLEATHKELAELVDENFLSEPQAKNTAPAIGWATWFLARSDPDAVLCVLPSDQHASDDREFRETLQRATEEAERGHIVTIGILPTRAETGYGYIRKGPERPSGAFEVEAFVEKPDPDTAKQYLASGDYLWNAGMFIFRVRDMVEAFRRHLPEMARGLDELMATQPSGAVSEEAVERFFESVQSISIDYGVMEKEADLSVVVGDFGWSDLGSWQSAWELSPRDEHGNVAPANAVLVEAENNLVADLRNDASQRKKVVALVGVDDLCVIETDDALLVLPRHRSQDVRRVVAQLKERGDVDMT